MSFGDIYTVPPGQGNPPGLPPVDLPQVEAPPARKPLQITVTADRPKSEAEAFGFVKGEPPSAPAAASAGPEDQTGFVKGEPPLPVDEKPPRDVSRGEAVARGAVSGYTFGGAPAIGGLQAAGLDWLPKDIQNLFEGHEHEPTAGAIMLGLARLGYEKFRGEGGGAEAYRKRRDELQQAQEEALKQHPGYFIGGEVPGALSMPMGALRGASVPGRIGWQGIGGAISGGLNEAGGAVSRGEDAGTALANVGKGAAAGGALGLGGGVIGEGLGRAGSAAMSIIRGARDPELEAGRRVAQSILDEHARTGRLPISREDQAAANAAGMPTALVDYGGERTRALARSAANTSAEARSALTEFTQDRFEQQSPRLGGFIRRMTGGADAAGDLEAIQAAARRANRPAYARAYRAGDRPIGAEPEMQDLMSAPAVKQAMRGAVERGQNRAVADGLGAFNPGATITPDGRVIFQKGPGGPPTYPNIQYWDYVQRELRDAANQAGRAGRNEEAGALSTLHGQLRAELDRLVPEFGAARQGASRFFNAENALEAGQNFVELNRSIPEARRALARMTPPERELFARGFASDLADKIERTGDNVNVINRAFLHSPAAKEKIEMALGAPRSRQIEALLRVEALAHEAHRAVTGNSSTARQIAEMGLAGGAMGAFEGIKEHDFNLAHIVAAGLTIGALHHGAKVIDERVARRVGEMLASNDFSIVQRGAKIVASSPVWFEALRRATAGGTAIGERHVGSGNIAAGAAAGALRAIEGPAEKPEHLDHPDYYGNP